MAASVSPSSRALRSVVPSLGRVGPLTIGTHDVFVGAGVLVAVVVFILELRRRGVRDMLLDGVLRCRQLRGGLLGQLGHDNPTYECFDSLFRQCRAELALEFLAHRFGYMKREFFADNQRNEGRNLFFRIPNQGLE